MYGKTISGFKAFYENAIKGTHPNPWLIDLWGEDPSRFETQILCHSNGTPVEGTKRFQDNDTSEIWGPVRWPLNAYSDPEPYDPPLTYWIEKRVKGIGTTWWDWQNKHTVRLGFDIDSLIGHAPGVGVDDSTIRRFDTINIPYITILRSTRGLGRHIYIEFGEPFPVTMNHHEHAAIARSLLPRLSRESGIDFAAEKDVCGGIMWIYHVNTTAENRGYEMIKKATQVLTADDVPANWRDHLPVVQGSRSKVLVRGYTPEGETAGDELDEMSKSKIKVPLDDVHNRILDALEDTGYTVMWVDDHHLCQTHTRALAEVHERLSLRGFFDTTAPGDDPGKPNCLSGDTMVITREGCKPIEDLEGKNVEIITSRGAWVTAPFKSYGEQDVFAVTLQRGNDTRVIKATADHRWFVSRTKTGPKRKTKVNFGDRKEVLTCDLELDHILIQTKPQLVVIPSVVGIQHGLVWGDGTAGGCRTTASLSLFGDKDLQLLKYFSEHPQRKITCSVGGVEIWNLPKHFKSLVPLTYDKPYLYGWLAGYFAADGHVSSQGCCIIRSSSRESIQHVKDVCHILGIETSQITERVRNGYKTSVIYTTVLKAADLTSEFFLIDSHKDNWEKCNTRQHHYWRVKSVEPAGREKVYCCEVPETHCFCLEDFILIGNCFMRPRLNGGWDVYRFGQGTSEHGLWDRVGEWTHIAYNVDPSFDKLMQLAGGTMHIKPELGYVFSTKEQFKNALELLGVKLELPARTSDDRSLLIRRRVEDGKPIICIEKKRDDKPMDFEGFVKTPQGWQKIIDPTVKIEDNNYMEEMLSEMDNQLRALKQRNFNDNASRGGSFIGWVFKDATGAWVEIPGGENVSNVLKRAGFAELDFMKGDALYNSWLLVNEPFKPEFPGGRKWNRDAPQLRYAPAKLGIDESPRHEWWDKYLNHLGSDLDEYIKTLDWTEDWNIRNGGDYLKVWLACMIRYPFDKLPYLFMWGSQETGKSMFYESVQLLMTKGVVSADKALTSEGGYNGELLNCVLAYIDETNVAAAGREVYSRLKAWTTGLTITIHPKYQQVFEAVNTCHFVQLANELEALPVFRGDKRITALQVPPVVDPIPKDVFMRHLEEEAPHFLYTLLNWDIPDARSRLRLPIIETDSKTSAIELNESVLHNFIAERCYEIPGTRMKLDDLYNLFIDNLSENEKPQWNKRLVKKELSDHFPIGRSTGNVDYIGNLSLNPDAEEGVPYSVVNRRLIQKGIDNE